MVWRRLAKSAQEYVQRVKNPFFPPAEKDLYRFASPEDLRLWSVYSDASLGGNTTAALVPPTPPESTASFQGTISSAVADAGSRLQRSGFCGIHTDVSDGVLNLEDFDTLAYRVRGDGRKYIASLRTENWLVDSMSQDVWQAFLFARKGEWAEVEVPLDRFLQTWKGRLVDTEEALNPGRIVGLGISVAGSGGADDDGDFRLDLDWIRARRLHATF